MSKIKKLTFIDVKTFIELNSDCKLISDTYDGYNSKLLIECKCGNTFEMSLATFKTSNKTCRECINIKLKNTYMTKYSEIYNLFKQNNCTLLTREEDYINQVTKVEYICSCGNKSKITVDNFKHGHRCNLCGSKRGGEKQRIFGIAYIENMCSEIGYKIHSKEYKNVDEKLDFECDKGHRFKMTLYKFKNRGDRCPICRYKHGMEHHSWNPNKPEIERIYNRSSSVYGFNANKNWRKSVFKKDNYTCKCCNVMSSKQNSVYLNAHHLNGWNWCKEQRFDIDNGATLCKNCHKEFHKQYGMKNNTKKQFEEFLLLYRRDYESNVDITG